MEKASRRVIVNLKGGWSVYRSDAKRATRVFETQGDAIKFGRSLAKKECTDLYVHRADGRVLQKDSFRIDPNSSKLRQR